MIERFSIRTSGQGLEEITQPIIEILRRKRIASGLCTVFIQHTSASILIQENADPSVRHDLKVWLNSAVPEDDSLYTHIAEGSDDMPAHIKSMLTQSSLSIPIEDSKLVLGVWQGVFLIEHRHGNHTRQIVVHLLED